MNHCITRSRRRAIFLVFLCSYFLFHSTATYALSREYELKAAFIEKFSHFIQWPSTSSAYKPDTDFTICVTGQNPFGGNLVNIANISRFDNKSIQVRQIKVINDITGCHILFISTLSVRNLNKILNITRGQPILTISDTPGYAKQGVMINFYPRNKSLGFEINRQAAITSNLAISSRLLKLARIVESNGDNP